MPGFYILSGCFNFVYINTNVSTVCKKLEKNNSPELWRGPQSWDNMTRKNEKNVETLYWPNQVADRFFIPYEHKTQKISKKYSTQK